MKQDHKSLDWAVGLALLPCGIALVVGMAVAGWRTAQTITTISAPALLMVPIGAFIVWGLTYTGR